MNTFITNIKIARLLRNTFMLFLIFVRMYSYGQIVVTNDCSSTSSPTTVDLTKHVVDNHPTGTTLTWHTGTPATSSNKYTGDPTKATASLAGIDYYAAYEDAASGTPCYSPTSTAIRALLISCTGIPLSNACPTTYVDLTSHVTGTPPVGTTLVWIKGLPLNIANQVSNPSQVTANGDYYAAYYDATNNCFSPVGAPITVTMSSCGTISLANVCPSPSVDLTSHASPLASSGGAPLKWFTSNVPSTTNMVADPTAVSNTGTYYPAYYDATNNCFSPVGAGVTVTITPCCPTLTNAIANNVNPTTCGGSDGSIKICGLTANSAGWTINYDKNGVAATALTAQTADSSGCIIISGLTAGAYTSIKVSGASCVDGSNGVDATLTDPTAPNAPTSVSASSSSICSGGSTTLSATCSTGTLTWFTDSGLTGTALASNVVSPSTTTTYYASCVTGACKSTAASVTVTVTSVPTAPTSLSASSSSICSGGSTTLSATCSSGTLTWFTDSGLTGTALASNVVSPTATTTYYASCITGACKSTASSVAVTVNPALSLTSGNFTKTNPTSCNGTEGTIKICNLASGISYTIAFNKNNAAQTPLSVTSDGSGCVTLAGLTAGTYDNFNVTNTSTTCSSGVVSGVSLALSDPPSATITLGTTQNPSACGAADGFIQVNGLTAGTQYTLNYVKNGVDQTSITFTASSSTYTLNALTAANYTGITVTNGGCISNALSKSLADPTTATISLGAKTDPTACSAYDGAFTVSGLAQNTSYTLNYSKDDIAQTPITFTSVGTSYTVSGLTKGSYTNISVNNAGCISNSISVILSDPAAAVIELGVPNNPNACAGTDGSITILGLVSGTTYTIKYKKNGIWQTSISYAATGSSYTLTGLGVGEYTNLTVSNGGCVSNALAQTLTDPGAATIALGTVTNPSTCGANNGSIVITGLSQGLVYRLNYVKDGIQQTSISFTATTTSYTLSGLLAANYTGINVKQGTCTSNSLDAMLSNPGGAIIDVVAMDAQACVPGNDGSILITGLSQGLNYTLNYMKNGIAQTPIVLNATTTSYIIAGLISANYTNITATQGTCISNSVNATISGPTQIVAPAIGSTSVNTVCPVGSANLNAISVSNQPTGTTLEWHTATPATTSNKVADPTVVVGGTYYAVFYNGTTKCYGGTTSVTVVRGPCANPDNSTATPGVQKILQVLANDKNPDGTPADLTKITTPLITTNPTKGVATVNPQDGTITYTPNANASGIDTFIYQICDKANPTVCDTALVTLNILCVKPVLTVETISCNANGTYNVTFSSDGVVTSNAGSVVGTTVSNIPSGMNVRLTSTSSCSSTSMLDVNSPSCPQSTSCSLPVSLSVGQAVCTGTGTYVVSYSITNGTLSVSTGAISQTSVNGTTTSGTITVSSLTNVTLTGNATSSSCTSQVITVVAPTNCQAPSCTDGDTGISYSTSCNGNGSYNINYTTASGVSVSSSVGSFTNLTSLVSLTVTENGCTPRVVTVTPPSCVVCVKPILSVETISCTGNSTYSVTFSSDGVVTSNVGTVSGTSVINIPSGMNVRLTSTSSCSSTSMLDVNSPSCPQSTSCSLPVSLSVGQAVCTGTGTYVVSYSITNGTLSASTGAISQTSVNGATISGTVTVSSLMNVTLTGNATSSSCTSQVITVIAPANCQTPSCTDGDTGISYSTSCNGNGSYNISYTTASGASVTSSAGSFTNLTSSVTLTVTENGCTPRAIVVTPPSCVVCVKPILSVETISCTGNSTYNVTFSSDGVVTSNVGTVSGTSVINIPSGMNVRLTSTSSCGATSQLDVTSPICPLSSTCTTPVSLSVGQAVCTGTGTYVVPYSISNGNLQTSSGTISQSSFSYNSFGTIASGTVTVSSLTNITLTATPPTGSTCTSQVITVIAPANCSTPSCTDGDTGLSYSTSCNGNGTYNINYVTVSGATVSSSTGRFSGLTGSVTLTVTENGCTPRTVVVTPPSCIVNNDVKLQVKVFLQGAFFSPSGATDTYMRDDLRSLGVIPTTEPYTAMSNSRFNKVSDTGGQTIGTGVLSATGVNAIVDWVFVELRDAANPGTVLKTRAALVQRDGDVVEAIDGITPVTFTGAAGTSYYVSIKHRNHLGAMTAAPITMATTGTVVDFTSMNAAQLWDKGLVLGDNSLGSYHGSEEVVLGNGKMGLWAGNALNTDSKVKYSGISPDPAMILSQVISYPGNTSQNYNYDFVTPVYLTGDINMDGKVKYTGTSTDTAFVLFNIINKYPNNIANKIYNFDFMVEQIP